MQRWPFIGTDYLDIRHLLVPLALTDGERGVRVEEAGTGENDQGR